MKSNYMLDDNMSADEIIKKVKSGEYTPSSTSVNSLREKNKQINSAQIELINKRKQDEKERVISLTNTQKAAAQLVNNQLSDDNNMSYEERKENLEEQKKTARNNFLRAEGKYFKNAFLAGILEDNEENSVQKALENLNNAKGEYKDSKQKLEDLKKFEWNETQDRNSKSLSDDTELAELVKTAYSAKVQYDAAQEKMTAQPSYGNMNSAVNGIPSLVSYQNVGNEASNYNKALKAITDKGYTAKEAESLIDTYSRQMNAQSQAKRTEKTEKFADEHPVLASGAYVAANVGQLAGVKETIQSGFSNALSGDYKPLDTNSYGFAATNFRNTVSQTVSENIKSDVVEKTDSEAAANAATFLYQTGLSMGDFASLAGLGEPASLAIMGTSAAMSTAKEATDRGASADKALATALWAGTAEIVFEKLSLENLNALKATGRSGAKNIILDILRQSFTEGSEEVFTDIANAIGDSIINGDNAELKQRYSELIHSGLSESEAWKQVATEFAIQLGESYLGGSLSGGVMGAGGVTYGNVKANSNYSRVGNQLKIDGTVQSEINTGLASDMNSRAYKAAAELQSKLENSISYDNDMKPIDYSSLSNKKIGKLQYYNTQAISQSAFSEAVANESNSTELKEIFDKVTEGKGVSNSEANTIASSNAAVQAINAEFGTDYTSKILNKSELNGLSQLYYNDAKYNSGAVISELGTQTNAENNTQSESVQMPEKAITLSDGSNDYISSINKVENGEVYLNTNDGKIVRASEVNFADNDAKLLYSGAIAYNTNEAKSYVMAYYDNSYSGDIADYSQGFGAVYMAQQQGKSFEQAYNAAIESGSHITTAQAMVAYDTAKNNADISYQAQFTNNNEITSPNTKTANTASYNNVLLYNKSKADFNKALKASNAPGATVIAKKLTKSQQAETELIGEFAKKIGKEVIVVEDTEELGYGKANGFYANGKIILAVNADGGMMFIYFGHELFHDLKINSTAQAQKLEDFVIEHLKNDSSYDYNKRVDEIIELNKFEGTREQQVAQAHEEIAANACFTVLSEQENFEKLVKQDKSLAQKVRDFFADFLEKIKNALRDISSRNAEYKALKDDIKAKKQILDMFDECFKASQKNNTITNDSVKLSIKEDEFGKYVDVDTDQHIVEGKTLKESISIINKYMDKKFRGKVFPVSDDSKAYVGHIGVDEYSHPARRNVDNDILFSKLKAGTELDNLLAVSVFDEHTADNGHHPEAVGGWDYYTTVFKVGENFYKGKVSIEIRKNGREFKDITKIKGITRTANQNANASVDTSNSFDNNVSQNDTTVNSYDMQNNPKFSLKENVEQTKDLIAVHNITEEKLLKSLNLGGLPMPSIAIMKAKNSGANSDYGNISLVFPKSTIDPQINSDNKVYGGDARTPVYPTIEYKLNEKKANELYTKARNLTKKPYAMKINPVEFHPDNIEYNLGSKGEKGLIDRYKNDYKMKQLYLAETAEPVSKVIIKETKTELTPDEIEMYDYLLNHFNEPLSKFSDGFYPSHRWFKEHGDGFNNARREYYKSIMPEVTEEQLDNIFAHEDGIDVVNLARNIADYKTNGSVTVTVKEDYDATQKEIDSRINQNDYEIWLSDLFAGIAEKSGIRNNVDPYTSSGNRRSFEQLHYEETLENVVEQMKSQENGDIAMFSGPAMWAVAAKNYGTLSDAKADSSRLNNLSEEEYSQIRTGFIDRLSEIAESLDSKYKHDNEFMDFDNKVTSVLESVKYSKTKTGMLTFLKKHFKNANESTVDDILNLVADIGNMPTGYFEAKPQRAVMFDEVATAIIPDNSSQELISALDSVNVKYETYTAGNNDERVNILNSLEDVKFSVKEQPIDYNTLIDENEELSAMNEDLKRMLELSSKQNEKLKNEFKITDRHNISNTAVDKVAAQLRKQYSSGYDKSALVSRISALYDYIANAGTDINMGYIWQSATDIAKNIIDHSQQKDTTVYDEYKDLRKYIRSKAISVPQTVKDNFVDYDNFRRENFGRLRLSNNGVELDAFYKELSTDYPEFFVADVSEEQQLEALANFFEITSPVYYNAAENAADSMDLNLEQFANVIAGDIFEKYFSVPEVMTVAEKHKKEIDTLKMHYRNQIDEMKQSYKERYEERLKEVKEENKQRVNKLRSDKAEALAKQKAHFEDVSKRGTERRKAANIKRKIKNVKKQLDTKLLNPTDNSYVPQYLVKEIASVCDMITEADKYYKNGNMKAESTILKLDSLHRQYEQLAKDSNYDYASEFDSDIAENISALADTLNGKQISELSLSQLEDVYNVIKDIKNSLVDATKQIGRDENISNHELGVKIIKELNATKGKWGNIIGMYEMDTLNPIRAIRKITEYNDDAELYKLMLEFNNGQRKADKFISDASKPFVELQNDKKAYKKFISEEISTGIIDKDGNELKLTENQLAQLIMTAKREQGITHIERGGFVVADVKSLAKGKMSKAKIDGVTVGATQVSDIIRLYEHLSDYGKKWIDTSDVLFNVQGKKALNDTSMILKHRKLANAKNYIPLVVDSNFTSKEIEGVKIDKTIEGMGSLKSTVPNAGQPVIIQGLNTVVDKHINDVSKYYGFAIPIRNFNKVYKVQTSQYYDADLGKTSVKTALENKWGSYGTELIDSVLADLQTSRTARNPSYEFVGRVYDKIQQGFVQATLAGNISVTIKQAASYPTAGAVLSKSSLAKGLAGFAYLGSKQQALFDEIDEHTGTHYKRRIGMSTQEIGELTKENALMTKIPALVNPMKWIQLMDVQTTAALWIASKAEIEAKYPNIQKDSSEYWKQVQELYDYVIETTQPNYDVLHRPEIQKTTNKFVKSVVMFKTQPLQNTGILYDALFDLRAKEARYKANKTDENAVALKAAKKNFAKAVKSQTAAALTFAAMSLLAAAIKHTMTGYRDDDKKVTLASVLSGYFNSMVSLFASIILPIGGSEIFEIGDELTDYVKAKVSGEKFNASSYDIISSPTVKTINDFISAINGLLETTGDVITGDKSTSDELKALTDIVTQSATILGVPLDNAVRYIKGLRAHVKDAVNGEFGSFEYGVDRKNSQKLHMIEKDLANGDKSSYEKYADELYAGSSAYDLLYIVYCKYGENSVEYKQAREKCIQIKKENGAKNPDPDKSMKDKKAKESKD